MNNTGYYTKQWSSQAPGMMIFLIDQSYSMREAYVENGTKAEFTATVINRTLQESIIANQDGDRVKRRVKIVVIGYGGKGGDSIEIMCNDFLDRLADHPLKMKTAHQKVVDGDLRLTEITVQQPVFFEAKAKGSTAMGLAFQTAHKLIEESHIEYPDSPAPIILNVSDGSPWSNERKFKEKEFAIEEAKNIMAIQTPDGNPLIFNAHIGNGFTQCVCPSQVTDPRNYQAKFLFEISSEIPEAYMNTARKYDIILEDHARGFVSNASPDIFIKFINFGSSGAIAQDRMSA